MMIYFRDCRKNNNIELVAVLSLSEPQQNEDMTLLKAKIVMSRLVRDDVPASCK